MTYEISASKSYILLYQLKAILVLISSLFFTNL